MSTTPPSLLSETPSSTELDHAPFLSWISDSSRRCTYANTLFRTITSPNHLGEALGDWKTIIAAEDILGVEAAWAYAYEMQSTCSLRGRLIGDNENYWDICGTPQWDDAGECSWLFVASEVFKAECLPGEVQEEHDRVKASLRRTMDILPLHAWYANPDGTIQYLNRRDADAAGLPADHPLRFGITRPEGGPSSFLRLMHPDDRARCISRWAASLRARMPHEVEARVQTADGYKWYLILADPMFDQVGNVICWSGVRHNIDEEKRDEEALASADRGIERLHHLAGASRLATSMAANMERPIARITELAYEAKRLLELEAGDASAIHMLLQTIIAEGRMAADYVIEGRKAFHVDGLSMGVTNVRELVVESLRHSSGGLSPDEMNVRLEMNPHLRFAVDEFKIQQVLRILLGRVSAVPGTNDDSQLRITAKADDNANVCIMVDHGGPALTLETAEFALFRQEAKPYDVELAVVRALVQSHGGSIAVLETGSKRAAFQLTLPVGTIG